MYWCARAGKTVCNRVSAQAVTSWKAWFLWRSFSQFETSAAECRRIGPFAFLALVFRTFILRETCSQEQPLYEGYRFNSQVYRLRL